MLLAKRAGSYSGSPAHDGRSGKSNRCRGLERKSERYPVRSATSADVGKCRRINRAGLVEQIGDADSSVFAIIGGRRPGRGGRESAWGDERGITDLSQKPDNDDVASSRSQGNLGRIWRS